MKYFLLALAPLFFYLASCTKKETEVIVVRDTTQVTVPAGVDSSQLVFLPSIRTDSVTQVTRTSALVTATVTSEGNSATYNVGVAYGTLPNPTLYSGRVYSNGGGLGTFNSYISGLNEGTHYYARPYATNSRGTKYGDQIEFTTTLRPLEFSSYITSYTTSDSAGTTGRSRFYRISTYVSYAPMNAGVTSIGYVIGSQSSVTVANALLVRERTPATAVTTNYNVLEYVNSPLIQRLRTNGSDLYVRAFARTPQGIIYGDYDTF